MENENKTAIFNDLGNLASMEKMLDLYGNRLMKFINCYVRDTHQAEDIMMEVFVELLIRKPTFDHEAKFQAYIYRVAKNKSINYLHQRQRLVPLDEQILAEKAALENTLYQSAFDKKLHQAMGQINAQYRQVLYLSYYEGMKNPQIAQVLELSEKAVVNLKHRAKKQLNRVLSKENFVFDFEEEQ